VRLSPMGRATLFFELRNHADRAFFAGAQAPRYVSDGSRPDGFYQLGVFNPGR